MAPIWSGLFAAIEYQTIENLMDPFRRQKFVDTLYLQHMIAQRLLGAMAVRRRQKRPNLFVPRAFLQYVLHFLWPAHSYISTNRGARQACRF